TACRSYGWRLRSRGERRNASGFGEAHGWSAGLRDAAQADADGTFRRGHAGVRKTRHERAAKMSKERAEYQDEPKGGIMMCGTCTLFIPPAECKVVEGFVAITGWCNAFDLAD